MAEPINIVNPSGEFYTVPQESLPEALEAGYRVPTAQEAAGHAEAVQFGKRPFSAAGAGAVSTIPGAIPLLTSTGAVDPETFKKLREYNPKASIAGEIGGIGAQLALLPGGGAPGLAGDIGQGIQGAVQGILGQTGATLAGSAVEGALYGANNVVNEAALGDPNLNAEKALSQVGTSAIWGAGLGLAGALIPPSLKAAKSAINKTADYIGARPAIDAAKDALSEAYATTASVTSGVPKENILAAIKNRGVLAKPLEVGDMSSNLTSQYQAVEKATAAAFKDIRPEETERLVTNLDPAVVSKEYGRIQDRLNQTISEMRDNPDLYPSRFPAKLERFRTGMVNRAELEGTPPHQIFDTLDTLKSQIDNEIPWKKEIGGDAADAVRLIKGLRSEIKDSLQDPAIFGSAGARQGEFNEAFSTYVNAKKDFQKGFMYKDVNGNFKVDPTKVQNFLRNAETPKGSLRTAALANYTEASSNLLNQIEKSYQSIPEQSFDKEAIASLVNKNRDVMAQQQQQALLNKMAAGAKGQGSGVEPIALGTLAHMAGIPAPVAGAIFATAEAFRYPGQTINRLVQLEELIAKTGQKVAKGAEALARPVSKAAPYLKGYVAAKMSAPEYTKLTDKIQSLAGNVQHLSDVVSKNTAGLISHAPQTTAAMHQVAGRALSFLASKIPQKPQPGPLSPKPTPSAAEIASFNRYYRAVENPTSILKDAVNGSLTHEGVEAVGVVYPTLFKHMQGKILEALAGRKEEEIPYKHRMILSLLLGSDVDGSMKPQSIIQNQAMLSISNAQTEAKDAAMMGPARAKGLDKLSYSERALTPMQAANQRSRT